MSAGLKPKGEGRVRIDTGEVVTKTTGIKLEAATEATRDQIAIIIELRADNEKMREELTQRPSMDDLRRMDARSYHVQRIVTDTDTYNLFRRCLHPDSRNSVTSELLHAAWLAFRNLEAVTWDKKTAPPPLPRDSERASYPALQRDDEASKINPATNSERRRETMRKLLTAACVGLFALAAVPAQAEDDDGFPEFEATKLVNVVPANLQREITHHLFLDEFCGNLGLPDIKIVKGPEHGTVVLKEGMSYPNFGETNIRFKCNNKLAKSATVRYTPNKDFKGVDYVTYYFFSPEGFYQEFIVKLIVK